MKNVISKYQKKLLGKLSLAIILLFAVVSLSGSVTLFGRIGGGHGSCPFMEHTQSLCSMGPIEHIAHWQQMFASLPAEFINLILLAIVFAVTAFILLVGHALSPPDSGTGLYSKESSGVKLYNYFIRLFSRGILHSKIYA